jgi:hypothetical protein
VPHFTAPAMMRAMVGYVPTSMSCWWAMFLPRVKLAARQLASRRATVSRLELEREGIGGPETQWTRDVEFDALREDFCALQRLLDDGPSET